MSWTPSSTGTDVWLVTGASSGLGRALTEEILAGGASVVAVARDVTRVSDLVALHPDRIVPVALDVTDHARVPAVVAEAISAFGSIDVLVNNAGYALIGAFEELSVDQVRAQMETNVLGAWSLTQAVLPHMRAQGRGTVVNVSSQGGIAATPGTAGYSASKFALEGMSEAIAAEVEGHGINVVIVEPGPFRTDMRRRSLETSAQRIADYPDYGDDLRRADGVQDGDPQLAARAVIAAVRSSEPPMRLVLGRSALEVVRRKLARVEDDLAAWERVTVATSFGSGDALTRALGE